MQLAFVRLALALAALVPLAAHAQTEPEITIKLPAATTVTGKLIRNVRNETVHAFRGIRYAEAPTGVNRWTPSKLLKPTGAINATSFGNICYTDRRFDATPLFPESEDCLFLNVYAPAGATANSKLPVMVWTHGGSWVSGNGNIYDGRNLVGAAGNNVVYVSFNYRLGLFGFLGNQQLLTEGRGANAAMRDMQNALQWVRNNIQHFGGNPKDVTAFAESAGAFMVSLQMVTNNGRQQLFDKAILESGAYPSHTQVMSVAEQDAFVGGVASKVNCTNSDAAKVLACLRSTDAKALMAAGGNLDWRPIVDNKFLVDLPYKLVADGKVSKIPTLIGTNTDEGYLFVIQVTADEAVIPAIGASFPSFTTEELATLASLYPSSAFPSPTHRAGEILGDLIFVCPSEKFTMTLAPVKPSYHYRFNETSPLFGVGPQLSIHTAELAYVFNDNAAVPALANSVQKFWTNFARYASPNGPQDGKTPVWPRFDTTTQQQIVLQQTLGVEANSAYMPGHAERCAFLNGVEARIASGSAYKPLKKY